MLRYCRELQYNVYIVHVHFTFPVPVPPDVRLRCRMPLYPIQSLVLFDGSSPPRCLSFVSTVLPIYDFLLSLQVILRFK